MNVHAFADNITLHVKNLTVPTDKIRLYELKDNVTLDTLGDDLAIRKVEFLHKHDYMIIFPKNILSKYRKYIVFIPFEGLLENSLLGYYRSSYYDKKSAKKT